MESDSPESSPPPRTPISHDGNHDIVPEGFGLEFSIRLAQAWHIKMDQDAGRLERYGRYGMTRDDLRQSTPEHMRESYQRFVEAEMEDLCAFSPPSKPMPLPPVPARRRSVGNSRRRVEKYSVSRNSGAISISNHQAKPNRATKSTTRNVTSRKGDKILGDRIAKSTHAMETRSERWHRLEALGIPWYPLIETSLNS